MTPVFKPLDPSDAPRLRLEFDGQTLTARAGDTLAAALLRAGIPVFRHTPEHGSARGPYCMMGACYDCLVLVDGVTRQACMTPVRDGMRVTKGGAS